MSLRNEVERIKAALGEPLPVDGVQPQLLRIHGGLPDNVLRATIGPRCIESRPEEGEQSFCDRCLDLAAALGEPLVIVGGLPLGAAAGE